MEICPTWAVSGPWVPASLRAPHSPFAFLPSAPPLLVLLAHSRPDFLARRRSGCPQQLLIPSPEPGGHRCCQQEAVSFQVSAREMGPFPPQPPFRGCGLSAGAGACCLPWPRGRWGGGAGRVRGERSQVPGEPAGADETEAAAHCSLSPVALWSCPAVLRVLPPS